MDIQLQDNMEAQDFLRNSTQGIIVRMRGLPYRCTPEVIIKFFKDGMDNSCSVMKGREGILLVKRPNGFATGDAFVLFETKDEADKALSKHKQLIGTRYIELFLTTASEVCRNLQKAMEETKRKPNRGLQVNDCIHLRGLPFETSVDPILEMLGPFASNVVAQGIHEIYDSQGLRSDEAFIQMDNEASALQAAQLILASFPHQLYVQVVPRSVLHHGVLAHTKQASPVPAPQLPSAVLPAPQGNHHKYHNTQNSSFNPLLLDISPPTTPALNPLLKFLPPGVLPPYQNMFTPITQSFSHFNPLANAYLPQAVSAAPAISAIPQSQLAQPISKTLSHVSLPSHVSLSPSVHTHQLPNHLTAQSPIFFFNSPSIPMAQHQVLPEFPIPPIYENALLFADRNTQLENTQNIHRIHSKRSWSQAFPGVHDDFLTPRIKTPNTNHAYYSLYSSPSPSTSLCSSSGTVLHSDQVL